MFHDVLHQERSAVPSGASRRRALLRRFTRPRRAWQTGTVTTAAALAVALPATGLIVAVVLAMWRGLTGRLDEHDRRLDSIDRQQGEILRSLGRLEGRRDAAESGAGAAASAA